MSLSRVIWQLARHGRGAFSPPRAIGDTGVFGITNLIVDFYTVRVGETSVLLFDSGLDPEARAADVLLAQIDARREDVTHVFLTHCHPDHVAGAMQFPNARIFGGAADVPRLRLVEEPTRRAERIYRRLFPTPAVELTDPLEGRREVAITDGADIDPGDDHVLALPLPGDTQGAYAYLFRNVLFVGDAMDLKSGRLEFTPAFAADDTEQNRASIAGLPDELRDRTVDFIATAHGGETPVGMTTSLFADIVARAQTPSPSNSAEV